AIILLSMVSNRVMSYEPLNTIGEWDAIVKFDSGTIINPVPIDVWATAVFSGSYVARSGSWFNKCDADMSVKFIRASLGAGGTYTVRLQVIVDSITITSGYCVAPTSTDS